VAGCGGCASWSKKVQKLHKMLDKMKDELKAVHEERSLWEQKYVELFLYNRHSSRKHAEASPPRPSSV
jgi:hypothetical protein